MNSEDIQNIFFVECEESLEAVEAGLEACRDGTHDGETINAIFRAVHSIKGGAGAFGYGPLQAFTHVFETLLADVREGTVAVTDDLTGLLLLSLDCVRDHVETARFGGTAPDDAALMAQLNEAHEKAGAGEATGENAAAPAEAPASPRRPWTTIWMRCSTICSARQRPPRRRSPGCSTCARTAAR
ncbi:Hpt domain-containing protein [Croceicoccus sp. YJ47]|uniref:Hpt domain-containing protein n=1 Tax=Croceicoccus sp. YJ47 TaxID=2798724 RepID=UPI001F01107E|nr:Hpt domain-containing protein [Croceicoccus sp. YJ47]